MIDKMVPPWFEVMAYCYSIISIIDMPLPLHALHSRCSLCSQSTMERRHDCLSGLRGRIQPIIKFVSFVCVWWSKTAWLWYTVKWQMLIWSCDGWKWLFGIFAFWGHKWYWWFYLLCLDEWKQVWACAQQNDVMLDDVMNQNGCLVTIEYT